MTLQKSILLLLETALLLVFVMPLFLHVCNAGTLFGILVSVLLLAITLLWTPFCGLLQQIWCHGVGKIFLCAIALLMAVAIAFVGYLSVCMGMAANRPPQQACTAVVLGCKVKGTVPSLMLTRRLDAAYDYLEANPDVMCIVSGGQGEGEDIAEATAMKQYLIEKGIDPARILEEDASTNTAENLAFSKQILEEHHLSAEITIITDGFHQYRAHRLAEQLGLHAYAVSCDTRTILIPTYWVREWMALAKLLLL
jgi:uncharacterized SAM-binding protein YcdF (DUF218 family)